MNLESQWNQAELEAHEAETLHKPIEIEYSLYQAIKLGDLDYVIKDCEKAGFGNPEGMGVLSLNPLTNIKYHFVVATAMITRHCIEAGMEAEQAFRISDFYIMKMDTLTSKESVVDLHTHMVIDFTKKMQLIYKQNTISKSIQLCTEYIYTHIKERITLEDLAEYTQLSPGYVSRLFKKEFGVSVSNYIRNRKIEKAQNLLKYSDASYIDIANYLAFSSQSHFIQTFRECTGMTPKKYRDKYYHTTW